MAAAMHNIDALIFVEKDFKNSPSMIQMNGLAYKFASKKIRSSKDTLLLAMKTYPLAILYAPVFLLKEKSVVLDAIDNIPKSKMKSILKFLPATMKKDEDVIALMLQKGMRLTPTKRLVHAKITRACLKGVSLIKLINR